ncbi:RagB/SusD family nutrient uptake outer membrane protein [Parapedobacter sp. 10938]|uniref:RagB/SusD family nutrient uptake outer membrane protein n=1 Tax=Parapedobacter flavus TaxID=3110225 RepID=UPI002DBF5E12|nr:RagB/SusD family nutrient uptake outer membrane protein [Parapedobacter sp. 10938]MEC3880052.1 RagB/SusD family nutrient uptake outer membrane protein [Parapedobacter sp. 10938]
MKIKHIILAASFAMIHMGCDKFLDRPPLTDFTDETAWVNEENVRMYANKYYTDFFVGYNSGFGYSGAALMGFTFSDDAVSLGNQSNFTRSVPNSGIWSYSLVRSINIMIDRVQNKMEGVLETEAYNHWMGIGRFFRGFRYAQLVQQYGDVPYYDYVVADTELDELYKPRTPRNEVMNAVYDDFRYALENVRLNDGDQYVNRYVVAGVVSRLALYEGTWQKYYYNDDEQARKFFELAVEAGDLVMESGRYDIVTDYRTLFTSLNLSGNKDCILYRHYDGAVGVRHAIASNSNLTESLIFGPSTDLIKSFICHDGEAWQNSSVTDAEEFDIASLIQTRDSRFEASFHREPRQTNRGSLLYIVKFLPRDVEAIVEAGGKLPADFVGATNVTDYPVLRYAEVLLNWIEAKTELASVGGAAVTQEDIDKSINKIRDRPLATVAVERGVQKTAPLTLSALPEDPERDASVSPLLWEIRRERRMEFTFESSRIADLERWHKLDYMDTDANPDLLSGAWVDFPEELPAMIKNTLSVVSVDGEITPYNGANDEEMVGFYRSTSNAGRLPYLNLSNVNPYLSPVGRVQMDEYAARGYELKQTEGWPQE